jgi:hypothetical protein
MAFATLELADEAAELLGRAWVDRLDESLRRGKS